jgi:hypothetical protein
MRNNSCLDLRATPQSASSQSESHSSRETSRQLPSIRNFTETLGLMQRCTKYVLTANFNEYRHCSLIIFNLIHRWRSRGSSVSVVDWTTGRSRFDPRQRQRIFPLTSESGLALGPTQPLSNGYRRPFPAGKAQPERDTDHSPHLVPRL